MNAEKKSDWYLTRKKMLRHEKYLIEKDQEHGVFLSGDTEIAANIDVYKAVERNMMFAKLRKTIQQLNEKEQYLITCIYFRDMTIRQYAKEQHIAYATAWERHDKLLKKMKNVMISV